MYGSSIIYFGTIFIMLIIIYEDIINNQHRKVIHNKTCKNFLYNTVLFLRMKSNKTNVIFQFTERSFDTPANFVQLLDIFVREFIIKKICNECFVVVFRYFYSDYLILNFSGYVSFEPLGRKSKVAVEAIDL